MPDTIQLPFEFTDLNNQTIPLIFDSIHPSLALPNYQFIADTNLQTNFDYDAGSSSNIHFNDNSIVYDNNLPYYAYVNTDILNYSIFDANTNYICSDSMAIDILCPAMELENTTNEGECSTEEWFLRFKVNVFLPNETKNSTVRFNVIDENNDIVKSSDNGDKLSEMFLPNGFYEFQIQPNGMNCFITEQYELQGELTATLDHIDPYECLAYVNISGCYNPFREQQDSIPYQVWCNDREIIADSCRWIENVRPSGFVERYYQCSIELNTGETLADLDIMSSLAPEDTLNYQIPNFSCNDDLCENIIIMPNPNNGIFDVQILQVPQDAQIGLYLYDIAGKLLLKVDNNRKENNLIFNSDGDLLTVDKNTFSFNLNNFPNGMYLLKIKTDTANGSKQTAVKKIMKMRNNNF